VLVGASQDGQDADMKPLEKGYVILCAPRTGSSYLCSLLQSSERLGKPTEHFNLRRMRDYRAGCGTTDDVWSKVIKAASTENGVFGLKLFHEHVTNNKDLEILQRTAHLPKIFLRRRDLLGQAISHAMASQSHRWHSTGSTSTLPVYANHAITRSLNQMVLSNAHWETFIARKGLDIETFYYEDMIQSPERVVNTIAKLIDVDIRDCTLSSPLEIQRNEENEAWRKRYLAENQDVNNLSNTLQSDGWTKLGQGLLPLRKSLHFVRTSLTK